MATGSDNAHTPWAQIGMEPSNYFDMACIPKGFKMQDPSRMGLSVKELLNHLRKRQEELGVNAFHFHHVLKNQKLELAEYPPEAMAVVEGQGGQACPSENTAPKPIAADDAAEGRKTKNDAPIPVISAMPSSETIKEGCSDVSAKSDMTSSMNPDHPKPGGNQMNGLMPKSLDETERPSNNIQLLDSELSVPAPFNFLSDPNYFAYQRQQQPQAPVYQHTIPGTMSHPLHTWPTQQPIMQGPNISGQAAPYPSPQYPMGPMMNVYHPQHGIQPFTASNGHPNYVNIQGYHPPIAIDPHLQLPPGEPTFSVSKIGGVPDTSSAAFVPATDANMVRITSPKYTPRKSSPVKKSPLKRKRVDSATTSSPTQTPTRRSGRAVRTPKKMQDAANP
jgi:hypothetical protein